MRVAKYAVSSLALVLCTAAAANHHYLRQPSSETPSGESTRQIIRLEVAEEARHLQGVELEGHGGSPASEHLPLQLCEGDCDDDDDVSEI